jgi:CO/xanthine dehydrogenase Mo-binding subunit
VAVLTAHDLPIKSSGTGRMYEPLAKTEVLYAGQPVALVVAESDAAAEDGVERVEVQFEPLPPVLDLEAATRPGAPLAKTTTEDTADDGDEDGSDLTDAHASVAAAELDEKYSDNVKTTARLPNGDTDAELAGSHITVKARFTSPWVYQAYLEPQAATAWLEPDGELVLSTATRGVRDSGFARQPVRATNRAGPGPRHHARRLVRRQDHDHRPRDRGH